MTTEAVAELSTKQLADRLGATPRMVNVYRAEAENRLSRKLGTKRGRTVYFSGDEQAIISSIQAEGVSAQQVSQKQQQRTETNFQSANNDAEDTILGGMDAIVQSGDQSAIQMGQALGQRWSNLMFATALQSMQTGMVEMQTQFEEIHTSVSLSLGSSVEPLSLEAHSPELLEAAQS